MIRYIVRHSRGDSYAVDEWEWYMSQGRGKIGTKNRTWYFKDQEKAKTFKKKKEIELKQSHKGDDN